MKIRLKGKKYIFGLRSSALIEMSLFFCLLVLPNYLMGSGNVYTDFHPHPFWFILFLIIVQYGTNEAILCSIIASFLLLFHNLPEQLLNETIYDYLLRITKLPLLWLSSSVIFGQLSTRHIQNIITLEKKLSKAKKYEHSIILAYEKLKKVKEMLEIRVASQVKGTAAIYESIKSIETMNQSLVLLGLEDIITSILNPKKFSIYALGEKGFESAVCVGWQENESFTRRYGAKTPLYREIANNRTILCSINKAHEQILKKEGILAAPSVDPINNEIFGMIKIEELDYDKLNISNIETFKVLCEVVGLAYANAQKYQKISDNSLIHYDTDLPSFTLFEKQRDLLKAAKAKDALTITIKYTNNSVSGRKKHYSDLVKLTDQLKKLLPKSSNFYIGKQQDREIMVIVPKATKSTLNKTLVQFEKKLTKKSIRFSYKIQSC